MTKTGSGDSPRAGTVSARAEKRQPSRKRVGFIGAGRVGCALAWHCRRLGYPISGVTDLKAMPRVPDTVWVQVPKRLYKNDARIVIELARLTGDFVSLAELKLYQVEDGAREEEGVQSAVTTGILVTRLLNCAPNPFGRATAISYQVGRAGPVALTVHDASGRVVRRLGSGYRAAGRYAVRWDGTDGRGLAVPAGVYFLRLNTNGEASSRRVTLIR